MTPAALAWQAGVNHDRKEGTVRTIARVLVLAAAGALVLPAGGVRAQLLITGNDEKVWFDPAAR